MTWLFWLIIAAIVWTLVSATIRHIIFNPPHPRPYQPRNPGFPIMRTTKGNDRLIDISGEIRAETERAYLFYDGSKQVWLPKSLCEWYSDEKAMTMPEWIAMEKGLI